MDQVVKRPLSIARAVPEVDVSVRALSEGLSESLDDSE